MLAKKLFRFNVMCISIAVVGLFLCMWGIVNKVVRQEIFQTYQQMFQSDYKAVSGFFRETERVFLDAGIDGRFHDLLGVRDLSSNPETYHACASLLRGYSARYRAGSIQLALFDEDAGKFFRWTADGEEAQKQMEDAPWVADTLALDGGFLWRMERWDGENLIRCSKILYGAGGGALALLYAEIDLGGVLSTLSTVNLGTRGTACLLDGEGQPVYPYRLPTQLPAAVMEKGRSESFENGNMLFVKRFSSNGWRLVLYASDLVIRQRMSSAMWTIGFIALALLVVLYFVSRYLTGRVTRPIIRLAENMTKSENALPEQLECPGATGEVEVLYQNFNRMIDMVHDLISEVYFAQAQMRETELMMLQAQINPHFLYNTLDSINWMAMEYQAQDIQETVLALSKMLRFSLNNGSSIISVRGELEQVKNYIQIMRMRHSERFEVEYHTVPEVMDRPIIKLVLQPLVENAIKHGFSRDDADLRLILSVCRESDHMVFEVRNNGNTVNPEVMERVIADEEGERRRSYGVHNVNKRLVTKYGAGARLAYRVENGYSVASFHVPILREGDELE